jgi:hypothetical protein
LDSAGSHLELFGLISEPSQSLHDWQGSRVVRRFMPGPFGEAGRIPRS